MREGKEMPLFKPRHQGGHDEAHRSGEDEASAYLLEKRGSPPLPDQPHNRGSQQEVCDPNRDEG